MAQEIGHRAIFYSSSKWLTNSAFANQKELKSNEDERLRVALQKTFGIPKLVRLQDRVAKLQKSCEKELEGKAPTAPDLWIVDRTGRHRFIEVKLPGDSLAPHQLAGLAAVASVLGRARNVSVEVVYLNNEHLWFNKFSRALRA